MAKNFKLSEEMAVQFLSRLPPKALMRFKCVRKSWYNLINNPSFVAQNLSISINTKFASSTCILFKRTVLKDRDIKDKNEVLDILSDGDNDKTETLLSLLDLCNDNYGDDQNPHSLVEDLVVPFPLGAYPLNLRIAGHCDGIICLTSDEHIGLCNPAVKEFKFLPMSCLLLPPKDLDDYENEDEYFDALKSEPKAVGFGYDSKAKVYKVVRTIEFFSGYVFTSHPSRVEVYTLGANCWREIKIDIDINSNVYWSLSFEIYFKGKYYWGALNSSIPGEYEEVIISFDMSDELLHDISVPESINAGEGFIKSLVVWKESIVLISYKEDSPKFLDIWVMDDFGLSEGSFTKYLTIGPVQGMIPLVFWKSDEILMVTDDQRPVSYNFGSQQLTYLPIHGIKDHLNIQAFVYVKSIISVNGECKFEAIDTYV